MAKHELKAKIFTIFPELFPGFLGTSLTGKALNKGIWSLETVNIRNYAEGVHQSVDDVPYGGGAGMVMMPEVLSKSFEDNKPLGKFIYMSPRGTPLTQAKVRELAQEEQISILCGRYEGVDQRILDSYEIEEISIGDYVLTGGEQAAMIMLDAVVRVLPNVLGNQDTHNEESFENGLLEYPHYTRPSEWTDQSGETRTVPEVLTSGHHAKIKEWRLEKSKEITKKNRPDLWDKWDTK